LAWLTSFAFVNCTILLHLQDMAQEDWAAEEQGGHQHGRVCSQSVFVWQAVDCYGRDLQQLGLPSTPLTVPLTKVTYIEPDHQGFVDGGGGGVACTPCITLDCDSLPSVCQPCVSGALTPPLLPPLSLQVSAAREAIGDADFFLVARTDARGANAKYGLEVSQLLLSYCVTCQLLFAAGCALLFLVSAPHKHQAAKVLCGSKSLAG
jgi:hypothetical protein